MKFNDLPLEAQSRALQTLKCILVDVVANKNQEAINNLVDRIKTAFVRFYDESCDDKCSDTDYHIEGAKVFSPSAKSKSDLSVFILALSESTGNPEKDAENAAIIEEYVAAVRDGKEIYVCITDSKRTRQLRNTARLIQDLA